MHRDIKPGNFLINNKQEVKLIDFGLAKCTTLFDLTDDETCTECSSALMKDIKHKVKKSRSNHNT